MNTKKTLPIVAKIYGILVTAFMLIAFMPKFIGMFKEKGIDYITEVLNAFTNWYDGPTAFFLTYFIGYIFIWKKPMLGIGLIVLADLLFFVFNLENLGTLIFIIPTFLVALLYYLSNRVN